MYEQDKENSTINMIKTMVTSPLFLVGAIAYSVYVVFALLGGIVGGGSAISSLMNQLSTLGAGYSVDYNYMQAYIVGYNTGRVLVALIVSAPMILIAVGMWISFVSAKGNGRQVNITGLAIIRVIVIIQLVCACVGLAVMELACISVMVGMNETIGRYRSDSYIIFLMVVAMLVIAAVSVLCILYFLKLGKTIQTMKDTAITGRPDSQISLYVEIFCYIAGGVSAISVLVSLVGISLSGFLANAGSAVASIAFGIFLRKYRSNMELLMKNPVQPIYRQQQEPMQPVYRQQQQQPIQPVYRQEQQRVVQPIYQQQYQNQDNETTVLPYYNETSVLSGQLMTDGRQKLVRMTRQKTGETICISKPSFWIGKDAPNVDYCITDNSAVSRRHVLVTIQNNSCYIRDNHSTNRVFINGQVIEPDADILLADGDRVRMGDEEFIVSIS